MYFGNYYIFLVIFQIYSLLLCYFICQNLQFNFRDTGYIGNNSENSTDGTDISLAQTPIPRDINMVQPDNRDNRYTVNIV